MGWDLYRNKTPDNMHKVVESFNQYFVEICPELAKSFILQEKPMEMKMLVLSF